MEVLILTVFVSLVMAVSGVWFFVWNVHHRAHEHIEQLSLLPLDEDSAHTQIPGQSKE